MLLTDASSEIVAELDNRLGGLRLDEIFSFLVLAEELHFGKAADRLYVTTGALSRRVARVERALGIVALFRTSRSVELTQDGARLAAQGHVLIRALSSLHGDEVPASA